MTPLAIFLNLGGPLNHPEHGRVHQLEIGIKPQDKEEGETILLILKTDSTIQALEQSVDMVKKFVARYFPPQAGKPEPDPALPPPAPTPAPNLIVLPCEEINSTTIVKGTTMPKTNSD
jgi:hypothetical protein